MAMPNLMSSPVLRRAGALASLCVVGACMGPAPAPEPGVFNNAPPDLRGARVMVFPAQDVRGVAGDVDSEIAFALQDLGGEAVTWIFPPRLQNILDRSPGMGRIYGLPVGVFSQAEVQRIGDPLYGDVRRLGEIADASVALIPLTVASQPPDTLTQGIAVRVTATVIHVRTGRVMWFGMVEGDAREVPDAGTLASAVDALARTLLWYSGR